MSSTCKYFAGGKKKPLKAPKKDKGEMDEVIQENVVYYINLLYLLLVYAISATVCSFSRSASKKAQHYCLGFAFALTVVSHC